VFQELALKKDQPLFPQVLAYLSKFFPISSNCELKFNYFIFGLVDMLLVCFFDNAHITNTSLAHSNQFLYINIPVSAKIICGVIFT